MDVEWKPSHDAKEDNSVALVQLYNGSVVVLIRVNLLFREFYESARTSTPFVLPEPLTAMLKSPSILKVGLSVVEDAKKLESLSKGLKVGGVYDVNKFPLYKRISKRGLADLVALFFHVALDKDKQMANWEKPRLTEAEVSYAATDAWASFFVFWRMMTLPYKFNAFITDMRTLMEQ